MKFSSYSGNAIPTRLNNTQHMYQTQTQTICLQSLDVPWLYKSH